MKRKTPRSARREEFERLFKESGLQQKQLAALVGKTTVTVNRWFSSNARADAVEPPFWVVQILRLYTLLPARAKKSVAGENGEPVS